jgi:hypothetical protein
MSHCVSLNQIRNKAPNCVSLIEIRIRNNISARSWRLQSGCHTARKVAPFCFRGVESCIIIREVREERKESV